MNLSKTGNRFSIKLNALGRPWGSWFEALRCRFSKVYIYRITLLSREFETCLGIFYEKSERREGLLVEVWDDHF